MSVDLFLLVNLGSVLNDELVDVELPLAPGIVHEPDLTEHSPLGPTLNKIDQVE